MMFQLRALEKEKPDLYRQMQSKINYHIDQQHSLKYFYTFVEKEGDWFGSTPVNLVIRHSQKGHGEDFFLFYEKSVELIDNRQTFIPCNDPNKLIRLEKIKLSDQVGQSSYITIVHMSDKQKLEEISIKFKNPSIAKDWDNLFRRKKEAARKSTTQKSNFSELLKKAQIKIKTLQAQLNKERIQKDQILTNLNLITEQSNHYKSLSLALQERNMELQSQINKIKQSNINEPAKDEIQQLKDIISDLQIELSRQKIKLHEYQQMKLETEKQLEEAESKLKKNKLDYQIQISALKAKIQELKASRQMEYKLSTELINKIFRKNQELIRKNKQLNINQLTQSMIIKDEQDYRNYCGHLENRKSREGRQSRE